MPGLEHSPTDRRWSLNEDDDADGTGSAIVTATYIAYLAGIVAIVAMVVKVTKLMWRRMK